MAVVSLLVRCDWPGCPREVEIRHTSDWHDLNWKPEHYDTPWTRCFCSAHRFRRFSDLDLMLGEADTAGDL